MEFVSKSSEHPSSPPYKGNKKSKFHEEPATAVPIMYQTASTPPAAPFAIALEPAEPSRISLSCLTLKLVPYLLLNFLLGTVAFCVVITGVSLAAGLLPLCLLGIPIYFGMLHITRVLTLADVALANMVTPFNATVRLDVPDTDDDDAEHGMYDKLRVAPRLTRISMRSSMVVLYFASIKFVLGVMSIVAVSLPVLPIASQIVASNTNKSTDNHLAGWEVHAFNFTTHPVWYTLTCIGYIIGGVVLMHVVGIASRETTRYVCCSKTSGRVTAATAV